MLRRIALLLCLTAGAVSAQDTTAAGTQALSVYLDCQSFGCDFDYFRTELTMVNWVRDRQVADIHLLVTTEETGAGGREFTVTFLGMRQFTGVSDTLKYVAPPASTEDDMRKGLAGIFRLGFVRYFARIPAGAKLTIGFGTQAAQGAQTSTKKDPWKAWVFRTGFNGFADGQEQNKGINVNGNFNASRVTEKWKTQFSAGQNYREQRNKYPVCDTATPPVCVDTLDVNIQRGYNASILQVRSISQHLSAGLRLSTFSSTFENYQSVIRVFPAIEYNVFPYSQSTRRQLTAEYNIGYGHFVYDTLTIFDKESESMPIQRLTLGMKTREPWGSIDVSSGVTQYLHDPELYRISSFGEISVRLFKGFEISAFGGYDKVNDQFNLRKATLTPEQILTREFQVGTGYFFFTGFHVSYTFGSIYNNVVNPRMGRDVF